MENRYSCMISKSMKFFFFFVLSVNAIHHELWHGPYNIHCTIYSIRSLNGFAGIAWPIKWTKIIHNKANFRLSIARFQPTAKTDEEEARISRSRSRKRETKTVTFPIHLLMLVNLSVYLLCVLIAWVFELSSDIDALYVCFIFANMQKTLYAVSENIIYFIAQSKHLLTGITYIWPVMQNEEG